MPTDSVKRKQHASEPAASTRSQKRYPRSLTPIKEQDLVATESSLWRSLIKACTTLNRSKPSEKAAAGIPLIATIGMLLSALESAHLSTGLPNEWGVSRIPNDTDWAHLKQLADQLRHELTKGGDGAVAMRAAIVLERLDPIIALGFDNISQKKDLLSSPAVKYASDMTDRKSMSRQPGYITPARRGKVSLKAFVDPELRDDFKKVAKMLGTTSDALLTDVVTAVVKQYNDSKEVPELLTKETEKHYQKSVQQAASRLVSTLIPK